MAVPCPHSDMSHVIDEMEHLRQAWQQRIAAATPTVWRGIQIRLAQEEELCAAYEAAVRSKSYDALGKTLLARVISGESTPYDMRSSSSNGLGLHWSTERRIAERFSGLRDGTSVQMFDGQVPMLIEVSYDPAHINPDPAHAGFAYGEGSEDEHEILMLPGAPLTIRSVFLGVPANPDKFINDLDDSDDSSASGPAKWVQVSVTGTRVTADRSQIDLYHHTTPEIAAEIYRTKKMITLDNTGRAYFSTFPNSDYVDAFGDGMVHVRVPVSIAELDDEFPSGEQHYAVPLRALRPESFIVEGSRTALTSKLAFGGKLIRGITLAVASDVAGQILKALNAGQMNQAGRAVCDWVASSQGGYNDDPGLGDWWMPAEQRPQVLYYAEGGKLVRHDDGAYSFGGDKPRLGVIMAGSLEGNPHPGGFQFAKGQPVQVDHVDVCWQRGDEYGPLRGSTYQWLSLPVGRSYPA